MNGMNEEKNHHCDDEIDLMEIFSILWRRKWIIGGIAFLCLLLAFGWVVYGSKTYTEELVQLNFPGIDKHQYPDGTHFEMQDLIAQDVLINAAKEIDDPEKRELFITKPRSLVFVDPFIPVEVKEEMRRKERDKETYIYLPNQFYIRFIEKRDGVFSHEEKKRLLLGLNKAYEQKFIDEYVDQGLLALNLDHTMLSQYDYLDALEVLRSSIDNYSAFLGHVVKEAGFYRSPSSGLSFRDILNALQNIKQIEIYEMESILRTHLNTKQKDALLTKYQYRIRSLDKEVKKKEQEARVARELLQDLWTQEKVQPQEQVRADVQSTSQLVIDSSLLDKLSEKDHKAMLLQKVLEADCAACSMKVEKKYLEDELALLKSDSSLKGNPGLSHEFIESSIEKIRVNILDLGKKTNDLNQHYLRDKYSNVIQVLKNPESYTHYKKSPMLVLALTLIVSIILGIFIALMVEYASTRRQKQGT